MKTKTIFAILALGALGTADVYADKGIKNADTSGDGFVSLEELKAAHSARIEKHFTRMDTNADGLISEDEMKAAKNDRRGSHHRHGDDRRHGKKSPEAMLKRFDTDGNGSVSAEELDGRRFSPDAAAFEAADADGSGELNADEIHTMMKARWTKKHEATQG